jgi:hypothetical protein
MLNFVKRMFVKEKAIFDEVDTNLTKLHDPTDEELKDKYLSVVNSFDFDNYSVFSEMCIDFYKRFRGILNKKQIDYCECNLNLSPKTRFRVEVPQEEVKQHFISSNQTTFYEPLFRVGNIKLKCVEFNSLFWGFTVTFTCSKCGEDVEIMNMNNHYAYGLATIGYLLFNYGEKHYGCKEEMFEILKNKMVEKFQ